MNQNIGPRTLAESEFNEKFQKAADALKKKFARDEDVEILVIAARKKGIVMNTTCCVGCAQTLAEMATASLKEIIDDEEREQSRLN